MRKIVTMEPHPNGWYEDGIPGSQDTVGQNHASQDGVTPNQSLVLEQHRNLVGKLSSLDGVEVVKLPYPSAEFLRESGVGDLHHDVDDLIKNGKYKTDSIVFVRDSFISNEDGVVLMSKFRKESRRIQSHIIELLLGKHSNQIQVPHEEVDVFEGGDFRYIPADGILFAGFNASGNSRNSEGGIEYVANKFGVKRNNLMIISARGFHIDTVFSIITDSSGKLIGGVACGGLIENYDDLEKFFRERGLFLYNIADSYGIPTSSGNQGATGAVNTLQVNENLIGGSSLPDNVLYDLEREGVNFHLSPVSEFWKTGGGVHCLTNQL